MSSLNLGDCCKLIFAIVSNYAFVNQQALQIRGQFTNCELNQDANSCAAQVVRFVVQRSPPMSARPPQQLTRDASDTPFKMSSRAKSNCFVNRTKFKPQQLVKSLATAQISGNLRTRNVIKSLPVQCFFLQKIVPNQDVLAHVFLGFTQNGQFLLSYDITSGCVNLYIWRFCYDKPLQLLTTHVIFRSSENGIGDLPLVEDMYETTAVYIYQWPSDDRHLLTFTVPDHHDPSIINVTAIGIEKGTSYMLEPGHITYSVVGWGKRHKFFDSQDKNSYEEYLTPGLIMSDCHCCTFHTGTEIICLKLADDEESIEPQNASTTTRSINKKCVHSKVLDVEKVLVDTLENDFSDEFFVRLTTYELLVFGVAKNPTSVDAFIHAVISDKCRKQSYTEFSITWDVDKEKYTIEHCKLKSCISSRNKFMFCDVTEKENVLKAQNVFSFEDCEEENEEANLSSTKALEILKEMIKLQKASPNYCLDNMPFVECQMSLETLKSPTNTLCISLSSPDCDSEIEQKTHPSHSHSTVSRM